MPEATHICFNAEDRSYFALLKKEIHTLAVAHGFETYRTGEIDIIVAEMASNLSKHAGGGEILVKIQPGKTDSYMEIISIDNGRGMNNVQQMMEDGFSTTNTMGHGLGSIKRLSDDFDIYSIPRWGTIVLSRIYLVPRTVPPVAKSKAEIRTLIVCKPGETVSGDGASVLQDSKGISILLGDGLGHGPEANAAVNAAIQAFEQNKGYEPVSAIREIHDRVKKTRGLVATVVRYACAQKQWMICGVGNIGTGIAHNLALKNHMTYNGIIGMNIPGSMKTHMVNAEYGQVLILCSDGIKNRIDMQRYPGILRHDLSIMAAAIYKDYARKTDDMSVLIARLN